ncbi:hypothetical protein [Roseovarius nitratireducens]|uniref:hypothetical protein n=1 Tax=Roseovarius nitratireducens TaxID=2044597 RepID=UPI000CE1AC5F|nr:hypothetical protein [Roseovarius nitratireducens]
MRHSILQAAIAGLLALGVAPGASADSTDAEIKTHKMTGAINVVAGARAKLVSSDDGISGIFDTKALKPGHAYTMWVAIINKPEACAMDEVNHCTGNDVLGATQKVEADITYGDGVVVGPDGAASFRTFIPTGDLAYSWLGTGLTNPTGAEVHFALHDHGPLIAGQESDMLSTARGGCTDDSLPPPWPDTARASGEPGPNQCQMAQFAILIQD